MPADRESSPSIPTISTPDEGGGQDNRLSSLKQERSRRTRAKLVSVALRLWGDKGFDETSVDELCEKAEVAKGTFYFYFRAKEDLLIELGFSAAEGMIEEVLEAIDSGMPTRAILDRAMTALASEAGKTPKPLLERTVEEIFHSLGKRWREAKTGRPHFREILTLVFERGHERGEVDSRYDTDEVAGVVTMVLLQGLLDWSRDETDSAILAETLKRRVKLVLEGSVFTS